MLCVCVCVCVQGLDSIVKALSGSLKVKGEDLPARLAALQVCIFVCGGGGGGHTDTQVAATRECTPGGGAAPQPQVSHAPSKGYGG